MVSEKLWINGKNIDKDKATINIDFGVIHYGTAAFEGILCIKTGSKRIIFRLHDHISRLFSSADILDFHIPFSNEQISQAVIDLIEINKYASCYIRPIIFKKANYLNLISKDNDLMVVITCQKFNNFKFFLQMRRKARIMVSRQMIVSWLPKLAKAKLSGKYLNSAVALLEAKKNGFDDAIILNYEKKVSEATSSNIFVVKDKVIYIPQRTSSLNGIVQDSIMRICKDTGYIVIEEDMDEGKLYDADEIFLTSTARGIISVYRVDEKKITNVSGYNITKFLRDIYLDILTGKSSKYEEWLICF